MNIEERLDPKFECYLNEIVADGNVKAEPDNRYVLSNNFVVQLPNVDNCKIGALVGITQHSGVGTIVDRYSHYNEVGSINHRYKVSAGTEVIFKIFYFSGRKKWMVVKKLEAKIPNVKVMVESPKPVIQPDTNTRLIKGDQGPQGNDGKPGFRGRRGKEGPEGKRGVRGYPGKDGNRGLRGHKGRKGDDGKKGDRGYPGKDGVNANQICRFQFTEAIHHTNDLYYYYNNFTYRYFGKTSKITRIVFLIGLNRLYRQPIVDVLVNGKKSSFKSPLRLPSGENIFLDMDLHNEVIVHDGDEISFPCIINAESMVYDLMIIMEFEIV